jgi:hypothetical protein
VGLIMDNKELNNYVFGNSSISIILRQFKEEHISESEAIQLIEDLYRYKNYYVPYWPQITYDNSFPKYEKYEITCKK